MKNGLIEETLLDEAVLRVLTLKFQRGLFEHPYVEETKPRAITFSQYPQTLELARQPIVLLKNENRILPLKSSLRSLAVIGPFAADVYAQLGDYTPPQRTGSYVTILDGLRDIAPPETTILAMTDPIPVDNAAQEEYIQSAVETALQAEITVVVLGGSSSRFEGMEFADNGAAISPSKAGQFVNLTDCR